MDHSLKSIPSVLVHTIALAFALIICGANEVEAAEFSMDHMPEAGLNTYILLTGTIEVGDWYRFNRLIKANPEISGIALSSDGGSLDDGLAIAKQIYEGKLDTILIDKCHSVCAIMFFAGEKKYAHKDFLLSLHTAYKQIGDWTVRDHVANGTVTWFLGHMGYPLTLAKLWVGTDAESSTPLTWELNDKWRLGIELVPDRSDALDQ